MAAWDPLQLAGDVDKLRESMTVHDEVLGRVARSSNLVGESNTEFGASAEETTQTLGEMQQKAELAAGGITSLGGAHQEALGPITAATNALREELDAMVALADPTFALIGALRENRQAENELIVTRRRLIELAREGRRIPTLTAKPRGNTAMPFWLPPSPNLDLSLRPALSNKRSSKARPI